MARAGGEAAQSPQLVVGATLYSPSNTQDNDPQTRERRQTRSRGLCDAGRFERVVEGGQPECRKDVASAGNRKSAACAARKHNPSRDSKPMDDTETRK